MSKYVVYSKSTNTTKLPNDKCSNLWPNTLVPQHSKNSLFLFNLLRRRKNLWVLFSPVVSMTPYQATDQMVIYYVYKKKKSQKKVILFNFLFDNTITRLVKKNHSKKGTTFTRNALLVLSMNFTKTIHLRRREGIYKTMTWVFIVKQIYKKKSK